MIQSRVSVEPIPSLSGFTVEWSDENGYILSRKNVLYSTKNPSDRGSFRRFAKVPTSKVQQTLAIPRLGQRLLRYMFYNVIRLPQQTCYFVTFRDRVGLIDVDGHFKPVKGLERPSKFLRGCCAVDKSGGIYLGEYLSNDNRGEMCIYHLAPGDDRLQVTYTFAAKQVRHIHGVFYDKFENALWCTTGDLESECRVMCSTDSFATVDIVGTGDETWRAVSLCFDQDNINYGMDAEFQQNKMFRIERKTGERRELGDMPGPVYYARSLDDVHLFGVTAEGCPSQTHNAASLWQVEQNGNLKQILLHDKDGLPNHFMPGTLHFNLGDAADSVSCYCYFNALKGVDGHSVKLTVVKK